MLNDCKSTRALALAIGLFVGSCAEASLLEAGSHCVAYKAKKTMFFVSTQTVVGKNCEISAQVLPEVGGLYHIEVNVPLDGFKSGDEDRDADVREILKAKERSDLTFRSTAKSADEWQRLFATKNFELDGELVIGEKGFPLKVQSVYENAETGPEVDGVATVRFADFELQPPKVIGGVVAKAKPELELHFHLNSGRILGADSIRLKSAGEQKGLKN